MKFHIVSNVAPKLKEERTIPVELDITTGEPNIITFSVEGDKVEATYKALGDLSNAFSNLFSTIREPGASDVTVHLDEMNKLTLNSTMLIIANKNKDGKWVQYSDVTISTDSEPNAAQAFYDEIARLAREAKAKDFFADGFVPTAVEEKKPEAGGVDGAKIASLKASLEMLATKEKAEREAEDARILAEEAEEQRRRENEEKRAADEEAARVAAKPLPAIPASTTAGSPPPVEPKDEEGEEEDEEGEKESVVLLPEGEKSPVVPVKTGEGDAPPVGEQPTGNNVPEPPVPTPPRHHHRAHTVARWLINIGLVAGTGAGLALATYGVLGLIEIPLAVAIAAKITAPLFPLVASSAAFGPLFIGALALGAVIGAVMFTILVAPYISQAFGKGNLYYGANIRPRPQKQIPPINENEGDTVTPASDQQQQNAPKTNALLSRLLSRKKKSDESGTKQPLPGDVNQPTSGGPAAPSSITPPPSNPPAAPDATTPPVEKGRFGGFVTGSLSSAGRKIVKTTRRLPFLGKKPPVVTPGGAV